MRDSGPGNMSSIATEVVLSAEKISKVYRMGAVDVHALREVDLELIRGDFVVILGPSGSAKSTLLNMAELSFVPYGSVT
jgi:putative ABC transport system ATP-binding protein